MKRILGIVLVAFLPVIFLGQKLAESEKSLLWEISGKDGRKTGYLFGTIHLKDQRVFNFYDSLIPAINKCDQFAIEVDPEILVRGTFEMETREDSVIDLREGVKSKEEKDLEEKLEEALGFSLHKMDRKKLRALKRYFGGQKDKPNDKPTFLDAWLCDFAKRTGKKIRGLETIEGHMEGYETIKSSGIGELDWETILSGKGKSILEQMVSTYLSGDQEKIVALYAGNAGSEELESLNKRNRAMAESIDSLLKNGSLFSAVGSAHLGGKEGVINLLKKRGYTLKAVSAARTGYYKTLKHEYLNDSWVREAFPEYGYSCVFPARPFKIERDNSLTYTWTDIGSGINYFSMANYLPDNTNGLVAEFTLRMVVDQLKRTKDIEVTKSEVKNTEDFVEALVEISSGASEVVRTRYIIKESVFYTLTAEYHRNNEHPDDVDRFMSSFRFIERKDVEWKNFVSRPGAFEVYFPSEPKEKLIRSTSAGQDYESHFYTALDIKSGGNYSLRWFDLPGGGAYKSDSLVLKHYSDDFNESNGSSVASREESFNSFLGFPSYNSYVVFDDFSAVKTRSVLRNGRIYTLVFSATKESMEKMQNNTFFNSFELKPFAPVKLAKYTHPADPGFVFEAPSAPFRVRGDSVPKNNVRSTYAATDPSSGINYFFSVKDFPPYYYAKNEEAFFKDADDLFIQPNDSLVAVRTVYSGEVSMREIETANNKVAVRKKVRYFREGNRVFAVIALIHPSETGRAVEQSVYRSVAYTGPSISFDLSKKKTVEFLAALRSDDTATVRAAKDFCADYNFETSDVPELQAALQLSYSDDGQDGCIRMKLLDALMKFDEVSTSDFLSEYLSRIKEDKKLACKTFCNLMQLQNSSNKLIVLNALKEGRISSDVAALAIDTMEKNGRDKLELYLPQILSYTGSETNWNSLYDHAAGLASQGELQDEELKQQASSILDKLIAAAGESKDHKAPLKFVRWLFEKDEQNARLRMYISKLQHSANNTARMQGIILALEYNLDVDKKSVEELASSADYRLELFSQLQSRGKSELFPKKYMNQREFSEADLKSALKNNETEFEKIEFYKEQVFEYAGFRQKMFVYKLTYTKNYETKTAIGFAGPYPLKMDEPVAKGSYTGTSMHDFFPDIIEVLIRQHIKKSGG